MPDVAEIDHRFLTSSVEVALGLTGPQSDALLAFQHGKRQDDEHSRLRGAVGFRDRLARVGQDDVLAAPWALGPLDPGGPVPPSYIFVGFTHVTFPL